MRLCTELAMTPRDACKASGLSAAAALDIVSDPTFHTAVAAWSDPEAVERFKHPLIATHFPEQLAA